MNAFDKLLRSGSVGAPEILFGRGHSPGQSYLGDPAQAFSGEGAPPGTIQYRPEEYTAADFTIFGISNRTPGGIVIGPGLTAPLASAPGTPFKPIRLFAASTVAPGLFLVQLSYGAFNLLDGDPVPLEMITEVSLANAVSFPTIATSQLVTVQVLNATGAAIQNVALGMLGVRVR